MEKDLGISKVVGKIGEGISNFFKPAEEKDPYGYLLRQADRAEIIYGDNEKAAKLSALYSELKARREAAQAEQKAPSTGTTRK